ncbi:MFS transporter [Phenylobacterium sp. LjRoot219]|uniref:MFS transporter n=1 Tax=Phenylobacterium sp. LjRoot219 TaxID=3342283 RepID=UPI003ED01E6D
MESSPQSSPLSAAAEWRAHWLLALAGFIGFSFHSLTTYSTGLFMQPIGAEFGWNRSQITAGLSIAALASVPLGPVVGAMIDRWGVRILAVVGLSLTGLAVSMFSLANGSMTQWLALWTFYAIVATGIKSTVWTASVTGTFSAARGMALGVVMCGAAAAQVVTPPLTRWLIDSYGWRMAYIGLGAGWGGAALIFVLLFFYDARAKAERLVKATGHKAAASIAATLPGLGFREAMRSPIMIRIAISTVIMMFLTIALTVHQVPILTEAGVSRSTAAYLASLSGIAGLIGKLATGWMTDRWNASLVGAITLSAPALAFVMLLEPFRTPALIVISMIVIGYASGAKLQICAYLTSRYVGMRNFGKVFGIIGGLIAFGTGLGPVAAARIYDSFGTYTPFLLMGIPGCLLCGLLIFRLGPYPVWGEPQPLDAAAGPQPAPRAA